MITGRRESNDSAAEHGSLHLAATTCTWVHSGASARTRENVMGQQRGTLLAECRRVLTPGSDYLFFEKVDCTQQSLITTMTRGALVVTPSLLAVIPLESTGSVVVATIATKYDGDALRFVSALLGDPAVDIAKLENALTSMYSGSHTRWVFPIAQLESFKVTTGFFGMISLKMPRESVRRIVIRDKGGKAAAKAFFDARALVRDPDRRRDSERAIGR